MWRRVKLGDILQTGAGGTPLKSKKEFYEGGDIKWLLSGAVCERDIHDSKTYITQAGLENSSAKVFPKNTVLIAMYGATAGQVGILRTEAATNQAVCGIYPSNDYLPDFLYYYLTNYKETLLLEVSGVAQPNLSQIKIKNIPLPVMTLAEQQRIVAKLDTAFAEFDRAIEVEQSQLQLLNKVREANLTEKFQALGDECRFLHLSDACTDFSRGKSKHRPRNDEKLYGSIIPFVQTGDISNAPKYLSTYSKMYSEFGVQQSKRWNKGTVCITIAANIAELAILDIDACFPDSVIGAFPNSEITSSEYLFYLLNFFQKKIKGKSKGSAQQNINLTTFSDEVFPFPALREQHKIVSEILELETGVEEIIACKSKKIDALEALKCAILAQELQPSEAA